MKIVCSNKGSGIMRNLIEGYNELEKKLGYEPNFHDDEVEKVIITIKRIEFQLRTVDDILYSLIFENLKEINLKGDFRWLTQLGVILDLELEQTEIGLKTTIQSSLGVYGEIVAGKIIVK